MSTAYMGSAALSDWDAYLLAVEMIAGRSVTDGQTIDMLYTAYLGDVEADVAASRLDAMERASWAVQQVRLGLQENKRMRDEGNPLEILPRPRRRAWWRLRRAWWFGPFFMPLWLAIAVVALARIILLVQHGHHP